MTNFVTNIFVAITVFLSTNTVIRPIAPDLRLLTTTVSEISQMDVTWAGKVHSLYHTNSSCTSTSVVVRLLGIEKTKTIPLEIYPGPIPYGSGSGSP